MCTPIKNDWCEPILPRINKRYSQNTISGIYAKTARKNNGAGARIPNNRNVCASLIYPLGWSDLVAFQDWSGEELPGSELPFIVTFEEYPPGTYSPVYTRGGLVVSFNSNTFIASDEANPESPVLSGTPLYNGPIDIFLSNPVRGIAIQGGFFDNIASMGIIFRDKNGGGISRRTNGVTGLETFGARSIIPQISSVGFMVTGNEPAGYAIGTLYIQP